MDYIKKMDLSWCICISWENCYWSPTTNKYWLWISLSLAVNRCQHECAVGNYGAGCAKTCRCKNRSKCYHTNGMCLCEPGYTGVTCDVRLCPEGHYSPGCARKCPCHAQNTRRYIEILFRLKFCQFLQIFQNLCVKVCIFQILVLTDIRKKFSMYCLRLLVWSSNLFAKFLLEVHNKITWNLLARLWSVTVVKHTCLHQYNKTKQKGNIRYRVISNFTNVSLTVNVVLLPWLQINRWNVPLVNLP